MKKLALLLPVAFILSACSGSTPSVNDLVDNPSLLEKVVAECDKLDSKGKDITKIEKCNNAIEATAEIFAKELGNLFKAPRRR